MLAQRKAENAGTDATARQAEAAGYVIPPTTVNPAIANQLLEGFAGKLSTAQMASGKNQAVTNGLARRALGLPDNVVITEQGLERIRAAAGTHYQAIKDYGSQVNLKFKTDAKFKGEIDGIGGDFAKAAKEFPALAKNEGIDAIKSDLSKAAISPAGAIEISKKLRSDASANFKAFDKPEKLALARAQRSAADSIEALVERNLIASGRRDLMENFREARTMIARSHDIEAALNDARGNVSAPALARIAGKGKPLGPDLQKAADFAEAFPKAAQPVEKIGSMPGLSPLDYGLGLGIGALSANPWMAGAALARPVVRAGILSGPYQSLMNTQRYDPLLTPEPSLPMLLRPSVLTNQ
jgi:hypothetical protein